MTSSLVKAVLASSIFIVLGSAHAAGGGGGSAGAEGTGLGTPNGAGANGAALPGDVVPPTTTPGPRFKRSHHAKKSAKTVKASDSAAASQ